MNEILQWIYILFLIGFMAFTIIFNIAHAIYWIKCFKVKTCLKQNCKFKEYCNKYESAWTDEDIERLEELIEEFRK